MAPIQPSASVAATGLGIRYIGNWAYALSGSIGVDDNETVLLNFTSGSGVLVAKIQFNMLSVSGDDYQYKIKFNDQVVQSYVFTAASSRAKPDNELNLIIPPFSIFTATAQNIANDNSADQIIALTGRVYGAE